ncbi:MAG: peptide-methionine (R)-S-oxide reductase MsrB [Ruthenibacterium sp.]
MKRFRNLVAGLMTLTLCTALFAGCGEQAAVGLKPTASEKERVAVTGNGRDGTYEKKEGTAVIYLAGGCFWGMEKLCAALPGVLDAVSGYANGTGDTTPTYALVCTGGTGFRETVRVVYDPAVLRLEQLLEAYFLVIDPTVSNRQGNDTGTQYQTGLYYNDADSEAVVERVVAAESKKYKTFAVEHGPLVNFYDAEAYHQDYLAKNPGGYCHIPQVEIDDIAALIAAENAYEKPAQSKLRETLSAQQYEVTQNAATERAFTGEYWDNHETGIYVDITTGQPLFRSSDKYDSSCGWPSFTAPITEEVVQYLTDNSHSMTRTEVKSALGDAHLGHVFEGDPESPTGTRYCINSASLRFVPKSEMEAQGYGAYLVLLDA